MEAERANGNPTSRKPADFRRRKVEEQHHSSALLGRIVEKGFPSAQPGAPASLPRPTVLPFPVARHRSHGPHWVPVAAAMDVGEDGDDAEADEDPTVYVSAAPLARPVQKKEKQGLDFSPWRELVAGGTSASPSKARKKRGPATTSRPVEQEMADASAVEGHLKWEESNKLSSPVTDASIPGETSGKLLVHSHVELNRSKGSKQCDIEFPPAHEPTSMNMEPEVLVSTVHTKGNLSFTEDINAENLARLRQMSPQEIAEAQAEIMEKMDPAILEMLKKRGQQKQGLGRATPAKEKGRGSPHEVKQVEGDKIPSQVEDTQNEVSTGSQSVEPKRFEAAPSSQKMDPTPVYGEWVSSGVYHSRSWKAWCERVEKVRDLRFKLDGSVVEDESSRELTNDGNTRFSQYNPENVTERDFLRTEGDPGAAGYTIKEAVALIRSIIPGQRSFALQLLVSVLNKCLQHLQQKDAGSNIINENHVHRVVDWQAVWAYALGPEPEIALSLRIALDDNHNSVILACAKVIQCILCCDINENYFNISEKLCIYEKDVYTAPVFRSRPEIDLGFLRGGFWKYSAKPSNVLPVTAEDEDVENDEKYTIQDDVVVAGQDIAAGLVRMAVLPRICYLLEMEPIPTLDESLVSVLIALARHSPSCATAIMKCPRLIETVVRRFTEQYVVEAYPSQIKSIVFLRVLSQADKQNCLEFVKRGFFREMMWHMYKDPISLDHWIKSGKEYCKITSGLMVEQLRFWKVCIRYGYCISYFEDFFPTMCMWLSLPTLDKLLEENVLGEFASVTREAYHVLEALSHRLPRLHSVVQLEKQVSKFSDDVEFWSWSRVVPMVELATKWLSLKTIPLTPFILVQRNDNAYHESSSSISCILWVISAIMHMLSCIFDRIIPKDAMHSDESTAILPWLPFFIPKVGLEIVKHDFFSFIHPSYAVEEGVPAENVPFIDVLCRLRCLNELEMSLSSTSCLHGLVRLADVVDKCVQRAKGFYSSQAQYCSYIDDQILEDGLVKLARTDLMRVLSLFADLITSEWQCVQSIEVFGRGGPAPGAGLGWGSSGGGFWSTNYLFAQVDAQLIMSLIKILPIVPEGIDPTIDMSLGEMTSTLKSINPILGICLVSGPRDRFILEKALDILLNAPVLEFLGFCINRFIHVNKGLKSFGWQYCHEDYQFFSNTLIVHFRNMWLSSKRKSSGKGDNIDTTRKSSKKHDSLETIHEDVETSEIASECPNDSSLEVEWVHQKLPIPVHWFLSPLSCINVNGDAGKVSSSSYVKATGICSSSDHLDVAKSGLFILFGLEALTYFVDLKLRDSPIAVVPLVWKLHALSTSLLVRMDRMDVLEDEKSRDTFESLQELYGQQIDQIRLRNGNVLQEEIALEGSSSLEAVNGHDLEFLNFQTQVHDSYSTFIETLIEQFGAISYGNVLYGRQVALYLHRSVEGGVRLAAWNSLTNTHVLELLPPLDECFADSEGYLEPVEDNEGILDAYTKSWVSGALDKAAVRGSVSFILALHHLSCFIFYTSSSNGLPLRNKLVKSLLRGYSRRPQHQKMLYCLIQYKWPKLQDGYANEGTILHEAECKRRFGVLSAACEGNSSLLAELAKLRLS